MEIPFTFNYHVEFDSTSAVQTAADAVAVHRLDE
jgi:hypothetical protein